MATSLPLEITPFEAVNSISKAVAPVVGNTSSSSIDSSSNNVADAANTSTSKDNDSKTIETTDKKRKADSSSSKAEPNKKVDVKVMLPAITLPDAESEDEDGLYDI